MANLIAPLVLEELIHKYPMEMKNDLIALFNITYKYAYETGKRDQRLRCDCSTSEDKE